jgi:predicted nucleotidyltransferase
MKFMNKVKYRDKNRYNEFLSAAQIISKKISKIKGVVGILATGGLGRGYCDDYSDLDLIVYVDDKKVKKIEKYIAVGYLRYKEIELDTPVESYQKALNHKSPSKYWSQVMRWDRENSQILFDTENRIKDLLKEKLVFPDWEQKKLLRKYRREVEEHLIYNFEIWRKRGDLINLSDSLVRATEHLILWIYAKNRKFQPYIPKWLFYYLENDLVPESTYFNIIKKTYLSSFKTISHARKIRNELLKLCEKIGIKFDYKDFEDLFAQNRNNWEKASEKTRYYLSW